MERLSPEILDEILAHVLHDDGGDESDCGHSRYATVCRYWQRAVESKTMRSIDLADEDLDDFVAIFSAKSIPHRRHVLRSLYLETVLPTTSRTPKEHSKNTTRFREVLSKLFQELASWNVASGQDRQDSGRREPLQLILQWTTTDPPSLTTPDELRLPPEDTFLGSSSDKDQLDIPVINFVTDLCTKAGYGSTPHPSALCHIVSRMPSLEKLTLELWEPSLGAIDLRRAHRRALVAGVTSFVENNPNLSELVMHYKNFPKVFNDSFDSPDFTKQGFDSLSIAVRKLGEAGKLKKLDMVSILITSDLFCDREASLSRG